MNLAESKDKRKGEIKLNSSSAVKSIGHSKGFNVGLSLIIKVYSLMPKTNHKHQTHVCGPEVYCGIIGLVSPRRFMEYGNRILPQTFTALFMIL